MKLEADPLEPYEGMPCPVCGLPDPEHDWDVHDAQPAPGTIVRPGAFTAGLPNMLLRASTRGGYVVRVLALHTTEGILRAADLRAWASWPGSSHAAADADGALMGPAEGFVPYHLAAWTLRSGNPWSENLELCGFARWTREDWLARPRLLEAAARWLADRALANFIPLVKITPEQYRAGARGVIHHHDHTVGYQDGTHWDVGTGFPWDVVLRRAQQMIDALTPGAPVPGGRSTLPTILEDPVQLAAGQAEIIPIPPIPAGHKAVLTVASDSVHGAVGYAKGMDAGRVTAVLDPNNPDWLLFIPPGKREIRDVSMYQVVHVEGRGADKHPEARLGVSLAILPA